MPTVFGEDRNAEGLQRVVVEDLQVDADTINLDTSDLEAAIEAPYEPATAAHVADITVDATAGGVVVLASNAARKAALIQNTGTANMRVAIGTNPTASLGIQVGPGQVLRISAPYPVTAAIKAIRESGTNTTAAVIEVTA